MLIDRQLRAKIDGYDYVLKSDVRSYYASLDHDIILAQVSTLIDEAIVIDLFEQFLRHLDDVNGELFFSTIGVGKGSSLSPLIGGLYLHALDQAFEQYAERHDLLYCRFMDDWVILTRKRGHLRKAVRTMNHILERLKLCKAPDKTYIGRIEKGFDFLGYRFGDVPPQCVGIALNTWKNHFDKLTQCVRRGFDEEALLDYIKRWWSWVRVEGLVFDF